MVDERNRGTGVFPAVPADAPMTGGDLPPRRVRQAMARRERLNRSLRMGGLLFGLTFAGLVAYELFRAVEQPVAVQWQSRPASAPPAPDPASLEPDRAPPASPAPPASQQAKGKESQSPAMASPATAKPPVQPDKKSVTVPTSAQTASARPAPQQTPAASGVQKQPVPSKISGQARVIRHVVKPGDTLIQLSRRYYGHERGVARIARYNGINPDQPLPVGRVLAVPVGSR